MHVYMYMFCVVTTGVVLEVVRRRSVGVVRGAGVPREGADVGISIITIGPSARLS